MGLNLRDFIPDHNFREDDSGELGKLVDDVFQPSVDELNLEVLRFKNQKDPDLADENAVNAMLADLGNPFPSALLQPLPRRRLILKVLIEVYRTKGTSWGVENAIRAVTGIDSTVVSPSDLVDGWVLDEDELSDVGEADPVDPFNTNIAILGQAELGPYSFHVEVDRTLTDDEAAVLGQIISKTKPAHMHFLGFRTPTQFVTPDHWELGYSVLHDAGEPLLGDEIDLHD